MPSLAAFAEALGKVAQSILSAYAKWAGEVFTSLAYFPVRFPGEHPAKYVMRIGPESGHTIHPGEEWRYVGRPYDDWWGQSEKDRRADSMFYGA